jgi:hypothetical protein
MKIKIKSFDGLLRVPKKDVFQGRSQVSHHCTLGEVDFWIFLDFQFHAVCN